MDPITLTAMTALGIFFGNVVGGAGTKIGEAAVEQAEHIFEAIKDRFSKENDSGKSIRALTNMADDPNASESVKIELARILEADPAFKQKLEWLLQSGPIMSLKVGEEAEARRISQRNSSRIGRQDIDIEHKGIAEDITQDIS